MRFSSTHTSTKSGHSRFLYVRGNHLGNVLAVVSDRKITVDNNSDGIADYFTGEVLSANDYYAFGGNMPGRNFTSSNRYRYGMNGQEKDDEIAQGIYTAEYWEYDSRLGRRWNTDPVIKPWQSGYSTFANNPIVFSDPDGAEEKNQQQANKKDAKDGDTYVDKNNSSFSYNGGLKEWLPTEPGQMGNGSSDKGTPMAAATYNENKIDYQPGRHLDFDIITVGGTAGLVGGVSGAARVYTAGNDPSKLYSNASMTTLEFGPVNAVGYDVGVSYSSGAFHNMSDPYENPFDRVVNQQTYDAGMALGVARAGLGGSSFGAKKPYTYSTFGLGYGWGLKGLKADLPLGPVLSNMPTLSGTMKTVVLGMSVPTLADSIRTATHSQYHPVSQGILKRNPQPAGANICITCK